MVGACTGVAVFPEDAPSLNGLLSRADDALRASKDEKPREGQPLPSLSGARARTLRAAGMIALNAALGM